MHRMEAGTVFCASARAREIFVRIRDSWNLRLSSTGAQPDAEPCPRRYHHHHFTSYYPAPLTRSPLLPPTATTPPPHDPRRLLLQAPEARRRQLRIRTFAVVCLNEDCGLLEWLPHTSGMRSEIVDSFLADGMQHPMRTLQAIQPAFESVQRDFASSDQARAQGALTRWRCEILPAFPAILHRWFLARFGDPSAWLAARGVFTRSAAAWSMVGHVVGIGDRHGENIMLDTRTGECLHVDFDCLFDKGLTLGCPEIVPFRLTANMVDAMGLSGFEGAFRTCCEATMRVLRGRKGILMNQLESFLHDPLVGWSRHRKLPSTASSAGGGSERGGVMSLIGTQAERVSVSDLSVSTAAGGEAFNIDADTSLQRIQERLNGHYNQGRSAVEVMRKLTLERRARRSGSRGQSDASSRAGQRDANGASADTASAVEGLSIEGHVHLLLKEASSDANLACMYIGWLPFL